jgi:hypothetical protein
VSARYVRDTIRAWAGEVFTVPFIDTINAGTTPSNGGIWASVQFDPSGDTKISYCEDIEEAGLADFIFCGPPGQGDSAILDQAEQSIAALLARQDAAELVLLYAHAPEEFSQGSADHSYRVNIGVEYRHYYRRA